MSARSSLRKRAQEVEEGSISALNPAAAGDSQGKFFWKEVKTHKVVGGDLGEGSVVSPGSKSSEEKSDSNVGRDDLVSVSLVEDDGVRVEVVGELGVGLLSRCVPDEVHGLK